MRIHYLQHVPFEDPGFILEWIESRGYRLTGTRLYDGDPLPLPEEIDWLIVMGGPMSVHDEAEFPWLTAEKGFVRTCIELDKTMLGICLGAQLIADALGAPVFRNEHKEIGWFPIRKEVGVGIHGLWEELPGIFDVFHWHGETFNLPDGAERLASSEACLNQAFLYGERILGLQFHLEMTPAGVENLIKNAADDMTPGPYVQSAESMRELCRSTARNHAAMSSVLNYLEGAAQSR